MNISDLIDAAAQAAVESHRVPATNIWLRSAIHEASERLACASIQDDRMAACISLAKLETRAQAGTATRAHLREITLLKDFLNA